MTPRSESLVTRKIRRTPPNGLPPSRIPRHILMARAHTPSRPHSLIDMGCASSQHPHNPSGAPSPPLKSVNRTTTTLESPSLNATSISRRDDDVPAGVSSSVVDDAALPLSPHGVLTDAVAVSLPLPQSGRGPITVSAASLRNWAPSSPSAPRAAGAAWVLRATESTVSDSDEDTPNVTLYSEDGDSGHGALAHRPPVVLAARLHPPAVAVRGFDTAHQRPVVPFLPRIRFVRQFSSSSSASLALLGGRLKEQCEGPASPLSPRTPTPSSSSSPSPSSTLSSSSVSCFSRSITCYHRHLHNYPA